MSAQEQYDVSIIGGGLAGLSAAILLAKSGYSIILFEKETYPFHKVCGEYISLECWEFLTELGLPLSDWNVPVIDELFVSSPNGRYIQQKLPLGGFGVSRYKIDDELAKIARANGVVIMENTTVQDVCFENDRFSVLSDKINAKTLVCCCAFGKRANLDVKWKRDFVKEKPNALNNYIGVKYHAKLNAPRNVIALHNFSDGYCGISSIEEGKACICYLTSAHNLQANGKSIGHLEKHILMRNPFLKEVFNTAEILYDKPLSISQVSFMKKNRVENHMLMLGDAAGLIAPLCGNGMSMALRSSKIAAGLIIDYLEGTLKRAEMEILYEQQWHNTFESRLRAGRIIQSLFGKKWLTNLTIQTLRHFPSLTRRIIRQTHGKAF
ncbi:NAD(P)/FAD-dependent oxidoreductase [Danxiaibacter flavus]|uniref:NAD(P)/FAD-dependent oxidoreductase n=1 Tax=Danxiaibacter flavus TaxID=3049108 RepID=A0ABV3ZFH1_9BACT|nr:NAD(P)/FAD-dependent oxidoreductase [Chitinophagaceae bacterium DXS]